MMSIWTRSQPSIHPLKTMLAWQLQKSRSKIRLQTFCISSLMETSMVRNIPSPFTKKVKMVKRLPVPSLLWQQMIVVSKWEPLRQMRMVLAPLRAWSNKLIRFKKFKLQQAMFSQKNLSRSARTILEMTLRFLVMLWTKKKKQVSLVKRHGMTMTIKMASVRQKSQSIS